MHTKDPAARSAKTALPAGLTLPLEVRVHGRGGQGGVTCAKLIAALYTELGLYVQTFGDYGGERSGAPVQAYTRVDRTPIANHNKIYRPDHLLVLDEGLLGPNILQGAAPGALFLLNTHAPLESLAGKFARLRFGVVDATTIAREQGIGSTAVVIINTTILGAYARALGLPLEILEKVFSALGLGSDLQAAQHAYEKVRIAETAETAPPPAPAAAAAVLPPVASALDHFKDIPATLKTGTWSNQVPVYLENSAPCNLACPAGNDVVGFIQALKTDGIERAAAILRRTQALPSVCGRVCPSFCMQNCNRAAFDGAVNIRGLERYIADHQMQELQPEPCAQPKHVAVVGGGPAGLSAAYQLAMRGHDVTIFEAGPSLGGVLRNGIPAFRLPPDALQRDLDRILKLGVKARCNSRIGKTGLAQLRKEFDAVIVCIGFGASVGLGVKGETKGGVEQGLAFLDRAKRGAASAKGEVIVVGGGNTAIDCARTALRCGAASVKIVYRRARAEMPAIPEEIHDAEREGVQLLVHRQPVEFAGNGSVSAIEIAEVEPGPPDASGRRRPIVTDRKSILPCNMVLLALGQKTELELLPEGWSLREARAFEGETALPVWFAGDCAQGEGTVTHAIGAGRRAALAILGEAEPHANGTRRVAPGQVRFDHFDGSLPHPDRPFAPPALKGNFDEVNLGLAGADEALRCFSCGHCTRCDTCLISCPDGVIVREGDGYRIDGEYCKGCGLCVAECPRSAMEMREKHQEVTA